MTTPSSNFDYTDDSVIAKVSVEVSPQSLTDIAQITQRMGAMRAELEAAARANGTWLEYLQQVPMIADRANQAYREMITQMERIAYIQQEMGGGVGNVSPAATAGPQGGGYSTAAPQGYMNPFTNMQLGMGMGGPTADLAAAQGYLQTLAQNDPRMYANMMAARGIAVNPALLGQIGGAAAGAMGQGGIGGTGGGQGHGNAAPASQSPQATQTARDSAAPPDPTQGGAPSTSEPQNIPSAPHEDAPSWQQAVHSTIAGANQLVNESKLGGGRGGGMLGLAASGLTAGGKWLNNNPGAMGGAGSRMGSTGATLGGIGSAVGTGLLANHLLQNIGETTTQYQQLGSVQGGGLAEGAGYEMQARMIGLNPFITTEQARQATQLALSQGFRGGKFDTVQSFMLENFKNMGISMSDQMDLINNSVVKGGESTQDFTKNMKDLQDNLTLMKSLAQQGGASLPQRTEQFKSVTGALTDLAVDQDVADRTAIGIQESYAGNQVLRENLPQQMGTAAGNENWAAAVGQQEGVMGVMPGALPGTLGDMGIGMDQASIKTAKFYADQVHANNPDNDRQGAEIFRGLMNQMGWQLTPKVALEWYKELIGGGDAVARANQNIASAAGKESSFPSRVWEGLGHEFNAIGNLVQAGVSSSPLGILTGHFGGAKTNLDEASADVDAMKVARHEREAKERAASFASAGRGPNDPTSTQQTSTVQTEGRVSGELRVTVDQAGKVSAPQSIQLSGQQKTANAGYGSAQLNNPPPGDQTYNHSYNGWGPGG